jgi:hypothetical protein
MEEEREREDPLEKRREEISFPSEAGKEKFIPSTLKPPSFTSPPLPPPPIFSAKCIEYISSLGMMVTTRGGEKTSEIFIRNVPLSLIVFSPSPGVK